MSLQAKNSKQYLNNYQSFEFRECDFNSWLTLGELQLVKEWICSSNSKIYLREISICIINIDDAIEVLSLLSNCINIENVCIYYKNNTDPDSWSTEDAIRKAKNRFYNNVDIAWRVNIILKNY